MYSFFKNNRGLHFLRFAVMCLFMLNFSSLANESGNELTLNVDTEIGTINNFLYSPESKESTSFVSFSPSINLKAQFERQLFKMDVQSEYKKYQDFSDDDHTNYRVAPEYQYKIAPNKTLYLSGLLNNRYEHRGTGLSLGDATSLKKGDELEIKDMQGGYIFGTEESVAKLNLSLGSSEKSNKTRREQTKTADFENQYLKVAFDYLMSGKTYLASDAGYEDVSYPYNPSLDKQKFSALLGMKWQKTEISQLAFLLGYQKIQFKNALFADNDAFKWRINFDWHPIHSTKVFFTTERNFEETTKLADSYRVVDTFNIRLSSDFSEQFNVQLTMGINDEEINYVASVENEKYIHVNFRLNYQRNSRLSFFLKYDFDDLNAKQHSYNYQRNSISVGINVNI